MRFGRRHAIAAAALIVLLVLGLRAQRPLDADVAMRSAEARLAAGDATGALRDFRRAERVPARYETAANGVARALQSGGALAASAAAQDSIVSRADPSTWALRPLAVEMRNLGMSRYQLDEFDAAAKTLAELHALGASWLEPDVVLALALLQRGDLAGAQDLQARLQARYGRIEPLWRLGMATRAAVAGARSTRTALDLFVNLRSVPERGEALKARLGPHFEADPVAWGVLAEEAFAAEDPASAAAAWNRLVGGPLDAAAHLGLGRLALQARQPAEALGHFEALANDPEVPQELVGYWRGLALHNLGRDEEARVVLHRAVAANPLGLRAEALLGILAKEEGDFAGAEQAFARVLEIEPKHPETLYRMGAFLQERGRRPDATKFLRRYLAAHPNGLYAAEVRRLLEGT